MAINTEKTTQIKEVYCEYIGMDYNEKRAEYVSEISDGDISIEQARLLEEKCHDGIITQDERKELNEAGIMAAFVDAIGGETENSMLKTRLAFFVDKQMEVPPKFVTDVTDHIPVSEEIRERSAKVFTSLVDTWKATDDNELAREIWSALATVKDDAHSPFYRSEAADALAECN